MQRRRPTSSPGPIAEASHRPFRWDIAKREQLGDLPSGDDVETYRDFYLDLRTAAASIYAKSGNNELVFVGRSPENIFDYLSGVFLDAPARPLLTLLPFSSPPQTVPTLVQRHNRELGALLRLFQSVQLDPVSIASGGRQIRFVDFVRTGGSFAYIFALIRHWSRIQSASWDAVTDRIGFIGLTSRGKNSPNTWRWQQHHAWVSEIPRSHVKNVSVPIGFWTWIANHEDKTMPSFTIERWGSPAAARPSREDRHVRGLRMALKVFERGRTRAERRKFAALLAEQPEMKMPWLRASVLQLKRR
jgi:hypothetical protein